MIVARHVVPGMRPRKDRVPEGQNDSSQARSAWEQKKGLSSRRDPFSGLIPGTPYLATIVRSLRDNGSGPPH